MEQSKNNIYHYTDFNALKGILENKTLWLNNVFCCNDRQEIRYYIKEIKDLIAKELGTDEIGIDKQITLNSLYVNYVEQLNKVPIYVSCFTTNGNDAAQWDRYSKKGTGVCLEFSKENLKNVLPTGFYLDNIKYELGDWDKKLVKSVVDNLHKTNSDNKDADFIRLFMDILREVGCLYKHPSFVTESELRLYTTHEKWTENDSASICQRFLNNNLIEYCKLDLDKLCKKKTNRLARCNNWHCNRTKCENFSRNIN